MNSRLFTLFWIPILLFTFASLGHTEEKADLVVVEKSHNKLYLMKSGKVIMDFDIALGDPHGPKLQEGDGKTPEGTYILDHKKEDSDFYKAIHISYPSFDDVMRAEENGVNPGGQIMIHGHPNEGDPVDPVDMQMFNWTKGCIAVTNLDMELIWDLVDEGTPITIRP